MTKNEESLLKSTLKSITKAENNHPGGAGISRTFRLKDDLGNFFRIFVRRSALFPETFSVGINFLLTDDEIPLLRLNGKHGQTIEPIKNNLHGTFHSHNPKWVGNERPGKSLPITVVETRYASIEEALTLLCDEWKIQGMKEYFPSIGEQEFKFDA
jgi:hypothetical protein